MAATGEVCYYQKPIREYYDFSYDKMFDAQVEHKCTRFDENVIPARRCGTVCREFQPLVGIPRVNHSETDKGAAQAAKSERIRKIIMHQMKDVCDGIRESTKYLAERTGNRKRQLDEEDAWLSQPERQPDVLGNEIAVAEQNIAKALAEQAINQRHLDMIQQGRSDSRDLGLILVNLKHWATAREILGSAVVAAGRVGWGASEWAGAARASMAHTRRCPAATRRLDSRPRSRSQLLWTSHRWLVSI